ncbi:AMP-dependent synthetase/ligase [Nocardia yamanashiensis]|uniref:AMP-dependent synthetase/ligase n=1 Tax=Nocardia yamanashiensis TaxID=209247 RepID=UPI0008370F54|nr:AMP-dependent synthetase/ligase [Nocardia yamanashiensis]
MTSEPATLCHAFQITAARDPDAIALRDAGGGITVTWREYARRVRAIAAGLAGLGVGPGDTVAIMLTNRPEFHLVDTAVLHAGATPFSVYNTNPAEMLAYLFGNAGNRIVVCERQFVPVVLAAKELGGKVEHVVCVDGAIDGTIGLDAVEAAPAAEFDFESAWRAVRPEDLLTIVYTSGTTGPPKGVELTHANFIANARIVEEFGGVDGRDRVISYLPDAHAANRWFAHYGNLLKGVQLTTLSDPKQAIATLTEVRPTVFLAVPRIWVKVKAAIEAQIAAEPSPVKRALAEWAIGVGRARARLASAGRKPGAALALQYAVADRLVLSRIRTRMGLDQVRLGVTGAAPLAPEALEFVLGLGITVCEAYGMTECTAGATVNRPGRIRIGTVGTALPGTEIRLADDGEVLVRGANVMRGYRNDPEQTAAAVDADGWLHTGDIGTLDADGYLSIVDRKKELIINAAGKNMSPANIENAIAVATPLAGPVAVIGDARPYNTALICLDPDAAAAFAERHAIPDRSLSALAVNPLVRTEIQAGVDAANATLSRVEQIKKYTVIGESWEPGTTHLTPTGKLRRKPIAVTYADAIESMYA